MHVLSCTCTRTTHVHVVSPLFIYIAYFKQHRNKFLKLNVCFRFTDLTRSAVENFVYVTGVSEDHFLEFKAGITQLRLRGSTREIVLYDLGLTEQQKAEVIDFIL